MLATSMDSVKIVTFHVQAAVDPPKLSAMRGISKTLYVRDATTCVSGVGSLKMSPNAVNVCLESFYGKPLVTVNVLTSD